MNAFNILFFLYFYLQQRTEGRANFKRRDILEEKEEIGEKGRGGGVEKAEL